MTDNDQLMDVDEVARKLNCSVSFVYNLMATGALRHYVLGSGQGAKRCSAEQLAEYLASRERKTPREEPRKWKHLQ